MQSPPVPRYLVPPRSKYSPQHLVLKHPQLPFLPQCQRPSYCYYYYYYYYYKLDWSVYTCLTQLYDGRDKYIIYYMKNNYMFRHFTLAVFVLRNENLTNLKMANEKCQNK